MVCHLDAGGRRHGPAAEVGRDSHRQRADADEAEGQNQALTGQTAPDAVVLKVEWRKDSRA